MAKSRKQFEVEHAAFRDRLRAIHASPVGIAAQKAMNDLRAAYRDAALAHWSELGNRASTGWGQPPEADYLTPTDPALRADTIAATLAHYFSQDPDSPPGSRSDETTEKLEG